MKWLLNIQPHLNCVAMDKSLRFTFWPTLYNANLNDHTPIKVTQSSQLDNIAVTLQYISSHFIILLCKKEDFTDVCPFLRDSSCCAENMFRVSRYSCNVKATSHCRQIQYNCDACDELNRMHIVSALVTFEFIYCRIFVNIRIIMMQTVEWQPYLPIPPVPIPIPVPERKYIQE